MIILILAVLIGPIIITAFFVAEVIVGLARDTRAEPKASRAPRTVVVMPAHDEEFVIERTLRSLIPQLDGWATALIVADNCRDSTAQLASDAGANVIERSSEMERGKGFALAFAQAHLRGDPPEAVIVLDADCASDRESLQALATACVERNRPCQSVNLIRPKFDASPMVQLSNFAFMVKNLIRQRGLFRLSGRVNLTGTGMAFPWPLFESAPLASASIVEDVELGRTLDRQGFPPKLVAAASVWSDPAGADGTLVQRTRWEGGFLSLAKKTAPRALSRAISSGRPRELAAALDLCVPPLTLLVVIDVAALLGSALLAGLAGGPWWPVALHACLCAAALMAILVAWLREGRSFIRFRTLLKVPFYVLWKIPLYLGLLRGSPQEWLRTGR